MRCTTFGAAALLCLCFSSGYSRTGNHPDICRYGRFFYPAGDSISPREFSFNPISEHALNVLNSRYAGLNKLVDRQTEKMLLRMQKKELDLQRKIQGKDSLKAKVLFARTRADYQLLLARLQSGKNAPGPGMAANANLLKQYIPGVDSMQTVLRFLGQPAGQGGLPGLLPGQIQRVESASQQLLRLQGALQNANEVQHFIRQREQELKDQLINSGVARQLRGINEEAYYYQARLSQYKDMLNDPDKITQEVLSAVREAPAFQRFWQQNSYYAKLFPAPSPGVAGTPMALAGLQTRDQVQKEVQSRLELSANKEASQAAEKADNGSGGNGLAYVQRQMQAMEAQLQRMKSNIAAYSAGSSTGLSNGDPTIPDFQPNSQHIKTFLKRLQYSFMLQNSPSTATLPAISSLGLNIGYKISDRATAGIGGSYLLGLGFPLKDMRLSNQGVGIRSFVDVKVKGSIWIAGGFEYNYMQQFASLRNLPHIDVWQRSALIGITKKYRIGKRENNLQLLYDLLAGSELPKGQPFVFRLGWGF